MSKQNNKNKIKKPIVKQPTQAELTLKQIKQMNTAKTMAKNFDKQNEELLFKQLLQTLKASYNSVSDNTKGLATSIPNMYTSPLYPFIINPDTVSCMTYERMANQFPIRGYLEKIVSYQINRIGEYHHPKKEVQELVRFCLKNIEGGFHNNIKQMLYTSMVIGNSISEMIPKTDLLYKNKYIWTIGNIIHLPPVSNRLAVDACGKIIGYFQYVSSATANVNVINGYGAPFLPSNIMQNGIYNGLNGFNVGVDPLSYQGSMSFPYRTSTLPMTTGLVKLDEDYILHFTHNNPTDYSSTYGISSLKPINDLWLQRLALIDILMRGIAKRVLPTLVGYVDPKAKLQDQVTLLIDAVAEVCTTQPDTMIFPGLKKQAVEFEVLQTNGEFEVFDKFLKYLDDAIADCLNAGRPDSSSSSYASAYQQDDVFCQIHDVGVDSICSLIIDKLVRFIIEANFEYTEYENDLGKFSKNVISIDDKIKYVQIAKESILHNIINDGNNTNSNDNNVVRGMLGFEPTHDAISNEIAKPSPTNQRGVEEATNKPYSHDKKITGER